MDHLPLVEDNGDADLSRIAEESRRAEELFEEKLMEARDSIARVFEEHRRMRREMVSLARLFEMWRNEEWSRQSEAHLCSRLNLLRFCNCFIRNAHEPVRRRFMNLSLCLLDQAQGGSSGSRVSHLQVMGELTLLKDELRGEITTMNDEVVDMQEFKMKYPQAGFLTDIEESAQGVADAAVVLLSTLKREMEELASFFTHISQ
ncbi:hypothetical protein PRIPAC_93185 [Pristionchus pacificus]|uniref:Uncharacterized protein n=1 Tax=Pristionchus pacificus TaxID=54126 RepID=A0A2A6BQB0_PRIPA|nr:hypothetical protein PRIPAC_93185 [Pristionchus pacificus]|eukprot:PDM68132.1 hypothetical protein PRIPAC_46176 [Pristionchus pacificus]